MDLLSEEEKQLVVVLEQTLANERLFHTAHPMYMKLIKRQIEFEEEMVKICKYIFVDYHLVSKYIKQFHKDMKKVKCYYYDNEQFLSKWFMIKFGEDKLEPCSICYLPLYESEIAKPCPQCKKSCLHLNCLEEFHKVSQTSTCPMCRFSLIPEDLPELIDIRNYYPDHILEHYPIEHDSDYYPDYNLGERYDDSDDDIPELVDMYER